jgi:ADP-ribose pyrophosphatase YjhB (NUDIX family)
LGEGGLEPVFIAPVSSPSSPSTHPTPRAEPSRPKSKTGQRKHGKKPGSGEKNSNSLYVKKNPEQRVEEVSAGGLVVDKSGDLGLLIGRIDKRGRMLWSLPKGHIEPGESPEEAALREVREETGIKSSITRSLGVIDFWFMVEGKRVHKTVHHFLLAEKSGMLEAQANEVDEVKWFPLDDIAKTLAYSDERKLIQQSGDLRK